WRPMDWTEVAGFVTGAACVALVVRRSVWNFPVGIANNVLFLVLFTGAGLYGDAALQVLYIALAALGWWPWLRGGPDRGALTVSRTPRWFWPVAVVLVAVATSRA
ncbi:MAG: nicotinamide riboside transporter PnuC, partial [Humibacillus sp.]|nr:nicotinamide riboside transporter PnuC [Humibacillus sp.]